MRKQRRTAILVIALMPLMGACPPPGGGTDMSFLALLGLGSGPQTPAQTYTVSGNVTGLGASESVTLQLNSAETKTVSANQSFTFSTALSNSASYSVLVTGTTGGTNCVASSNTGTVASSNVTSIAVHCSTTLYTLRVNVTGLDGSNSLVIQNNATNDTTVSANGITNFTSQVPAGSMYAVTVKTQPSTNPQTCTPSANSGQMSANPTTITIACSPDYYTVSGTYSGLAGNGLQVRLTNTGETITKNIADGAGGALTFSAPVANGASYSVTVIQNPSVLNQTCVVTSGSGTISGANITNVSVACTTNEYTVGGTITGMTTGDSVTLTESGGSNLVVNFPTSTFSWNKADGSSYTVAVQTHAAGKTCSVTNGTGGPINGSNVSNISISCAFNTYTVGGNVSGLCAGQSVTVQNNGGSAQVVNGSSSFTFPAQNDLSAYSVTVSGAPSGVSCNVTSGSGNLAGANVTNVAVACTGCMSCAGAGQFTVSWTASRAYDVTTFAGGGHRIYYSTSSGVTTATTTYFDVPNTTSTTQGVLTGRTSACTYYVKVQPYSSLRPAGGTGAELSGEFSTTIP